MSCCLAGIIEEDEESENYTSLGGFKKNRSCTDKVLFVGMGIFFAILFALIGVAFVKGDVNRYINGYDDCGNICGKNNHRPADYPYQCFGEDMTDKKYLLTKYLTKSIVNYTVKECVKDCKAEGGFILFLNRCFIKSRNMTDVNDIDIGGSFLQNFSEDLRQCWGHIVLVSLLVVVLSIMMLFLLRYATAFVVWFTLVAIIVLFAGISIFSWTMYNNVVEAIKNNYHSHLNDKNKQIYFLIAASFCTAMSIIVLLLTVVFFKRIKLIIQLFKEAAKAVADMPLIVIQPVYTFIALLIIYTSGAYFTMWISSYANLTKQYTTIVEQRVLLAYEPTAVSLLSNGLNFFGILWMIQFVIGCQHFIIGGCVATWFFARDKNNLGSPIISNSTNLVKYHLGTIAYSSLIITFVEIVKKIIRGLRKTLETRKNSVIVLLLCILGPLIEGIELILKFFSRNAYVITAIYGYSFCKAGKKAYRLIMTNIFSVAAINSIGDYILGFMKLFIVLFSTLIGYELLREKELHFIGYPLIIIFIIAYFIAHCFITVFEMAIDTIFLCFCEDCEENDGLSKPYYMSRNLMEFVENSSKAMKMHWKDEQLQAWENGPKRILQQG